MVMVQVDSVACHLTQDTQTTRPFFGNEDMPYEDYGQINPLRNPKPFWKQTGVLAVQFFPCRI